MLGEGEGDVASNYQYCSNLLSYHRQAVQVELMVGEVVDVHWSGSNVSCVYCWKA